MNLNQQEFESVVEERTKAAERAVRSSALHHAMGYLEERHELASTTPEEVCAVAAKFEAYLTAPATVFSRKEGAQ